MEVLVTAIRKGNEMKDSQNSKEGVKLFLFADDKILYIENHKDHTDTQTQRQLKLISSARLQNTDQYTNVSCISIY